MCHLRTLFKKRMSEAREPCAICHEAQDDRTSTALECGHRFHTPCIMTWFRSGNSTCPLCRSEPETHISFLDTRARYTILRRMSRNRSAPPALRSAVARLRQLEEAMRQDSRRRTEFHRRNRQVIRELRRCTRRRWTLRRRVRHLQREIGMMPIDNNTDPTSSRIVRRRRRRTGTRTRSSRAHS
ncbi:MAG: hypothetical protein CL902_00785 [Dehalococcoidia bacterium]|nr:hypothetical protein [Dehalococcoidia bacterium]